MSEITDELAKRIVQAVCELQEIPDPDHDDTIIVTVQDLEAVVSNHLAATPSSQSLAEAVERWRRARIAACEVGLQHPDYMDRLNELSEAEDALSVAKEPT